MRVHLSRAAASSKTGHTLTLCLTGVYTNTALVPVFEPEVCPSQDFLGRSSQGRLPLGHLTALGVPGLSPFKKLLLTLFLPSFFPLAAESQAEEMYRKAAPEVDMPKEHLGKVRRRQGLGQARDACCPACTSYGLALPGG